MKIKIVKVIADNKFSAEVTNTFTDQEQSLSDRYSEPEVNFGGDFTGPPSFTLTDNYRKIVSGTPYTLSIDGNGDAQAEAKMLVWVTEIQATLLASVQALRAKVDGYTGEIVSTV